MMLRVLIAACFALGLSAQEKPCMTPTGDNILAGDLARAIPELAGMPSRKVLAPSPVIGGKRVFRSEEIRLLAAQSGLKTESTEDVCFAWPLAPLNQSEVLDVLRKTLQNAQPDLAASVEIDEVTATRVPPGELSFPLTGLATPASLDQVTPVMWRGEVVYGATRRFSVWARVRVTASMSVIVAAEKLEPGHPIGTNQVRAEVRQRFPALKNKIATAEQIVGMIPTRSFAPGAELRMESLSRPNDVNRGDLVAIEARNGRVKLAFSGRAESAGRTGDLIAVRNPETQRIFRARVCARDKAIVEAIGESDSLKGN